MIRGMIYLAVIAIIAVLVGIFVLNRDIPINEEIKRSLGLENAKNQEFAPEDMTSSDPVKDKLVSDPVVASDSGGGGGGGGGGGSSPTSDEIVIPGECTKKQLSYSLRNFYKEQACLNSSVLGCTKMSFNCSINVYNLDYVNSGDFEVKLTLLNGDTEIESSNVAYNLEPREEKVFGVNFNLDDINGIPEDLYCNFKTVSVPKVCI